MKDFRFKIYLEIDVKRKFAALFMMVIMCLSVFTGCSLVTRNDKNYFEAVVATITYTDGEKENITKRDLISAYNSYGYNYVDNYGYTMEQAVNQTLETIIDNRLTIKAVENYYEENPSEGEMLNGNETTYLWDTTYSSLYSNLKEYLNEVLENSSDDSTDDAESDTNASVYTPYDKTAYLDVDANGKYVIRKTTPATTIRATYQGRQNASGVYCDYDYKDAEGNYPFKEAMYGKLYSLIDSSNSTSAKNWRSAFNKYLADIKENYGYKDFKTDKEWFLFEMDRVYNILRDNYIVEKYEVIFNTQSHQDADISNITVKDVLSYYSAKVRADYATYKIGGDTETYASTMLSDVGSVDYILEGSGASNYFYVGYIKLEMTDDQKAEYSALKTALESQSIGYNEYEEAMNNLYSRISATVRDAETGEKTTETISAQNLLNKINEDVANYQYISDSTMTETELANYNKQISYNKADAFRKYLYLYNDDDALKGAEYNAVFGVDSSNKVLANDTFSSNDDVKEAILKLYDNGNAQVGDTTDFVRAEDGLYMFFYAGEIKNLFSGITADFDASTNLDNIKLLTSTRLNIFSDKTVFDKIYESLTKDNFSVFQNMNMNYLRTYMTTKIESITNNIKDLY